MITGKDIVCISSIDWDFLWQGHQEITCRLAAAGNRVLYVENTGIRTPRWQDSRRILERLRNWTRSLRTGGLRKVGENIYVCAPLVLPPFGSSWQRAINRRALLPFIRRAVQKLSMRDPLLWTYSPSDTTVDLVRLLRTPASVMVYYCVDNFSQIATKPYALRASEREILEESDVVFTTCPELAATCRQWNNNIAVFPFGVNLEAFPFEPPVAPDSGNGHSPPGSLLRQLPRPLIGYVGGIHSHIDFRLLAEITRQRPKWSLVLVGPEQTQVGDLHALTNVHFMGAQPHDSLASYVREFDVCIVPYVNSAYTATVVPTKINEYLALGKSVVSTNLPAVSEFNSQHGILEVSSPRASDFLEAIDRALVAANDEEIRARRRQVAELADWQRRLEAMSRLIEIELEKKLSTASTEP